MTGQAWAPAHISLRNDRCEPGHLPHRAGTRASGTSPGAGVTPAAGPDLSHATSALISRKLFSARKEIISYAQKLFGITRSAHHLCAERLAQITGIR